MTFRVPLLGLAKYGSLNSYDNIYFCRFMIQIVHGWFYTSCAVYRSYSPMEVYFLTS